MAIVPRARLVALYLREICRHLGSSRHVISHWKYFPRWHQSMLSNTTPFESRLPWITYSAIDFIHEYLHKDMKIFEFGTGGSTLFFADKGCSVHAVEHDRSWFQACKRYHEDWLNIHLDLVEPTPCPDFQRRDPSIPTDYISSATCYEGMSFLDYAKAICEHPEESLDLVLVDGRARPSCLVNALSRVKVGGLLVLDNSEREYYLSRIDFSNMRFERYDFYGAVPCNYIFSKTTAWRKLG